MSEITIGTRGSRLALRQAQQICDALSHDGTVHIKTIQTRGDTLQQMRLQDHLDKGFFTTELEVALISGDVDVVVHSLKDLPTESTSELMIGAIPSRAAVADVIVARPDVVIDSINQGSTQFPLRQGSRVGTSAARRRALLKTLCPELTGVDLRGNVPTRVNRCRQGVVDAIVIAKAGLDRLQLDLSDLVVWSLDPTVWLPAPGQGAIAVQCRADDAAIQSRLAALNHSDTHQDVVIERTALALLEGGCHSACGAHVQRNNTQAKIQVGADIDGRGWKTTHWTGQISQGQQGVAVCVEALRTGVVPPMDQSTPWWVMETT